jgi:hypothetical protein
MKDCASRSYNLLLKSYKMSAQWTKGLPANKFTGEPGVVHSTIKNYFSCSFMELIRSLPLNTKSF